MTLRSTANHAIAVIAWGGAAVLAAELLMTAGIAMVMARHRVQLPVVCLHIEDAIYSIITFPSTWTRPQTPFDNALWMDLSIGLFWGISLHIFASRIRHSRKKQMREPN